MSRIIGAFVVCGTITNTSPVIVGTGAGGEGGDIEIARGYFGEQPYIPATSLTGVLRHRIARKVAKNSPLRCFWGGERDNDCQSHFVIEDLIPEEGSIPTVAVRDGIKIDDRTGLAKPRFKFTREVIEPGARFRFHAEALLREGFQEDLFKTQIGRVLYELSHGSLAVGAMTTKGFGRIRLDGEYRTWKFDFSREGHARDWLEFRGGGEPPDRLKEAIAPRAGTGGRSFSISAEFGLKSSLIIGSYSSAPRMPDKVHLTCKGRPIISGTSLKGALRARAARIVNTFGKDGSALLRTTFGWAEDDERTKARPIKSKLVVEETEVLDASSEIQSRVKIDRFTGGALESALYDSMPQWETERGSLLTIRMCLEDFEDWEAGLLLHLLKDLWNGDLPVGGEKNVGRGVLKGKKATIHVGGKEHVIEAGPAGTLSFSEGARQTLENYAKAFKDEMMEACNG